MKLLQKISELISAERRQYITVPYGLFAVLHACVLALMTACLLLRHGIWIIASVVLLFPLVYITVQYYKLWRVYYSRLMFVLIFCFTAALSWFASDFVYSLFVK